MAATRGKGKQTTDEKASTKKPREKPLQWDQNKDWTHRAIAHLIQFPNFRRKLFSDSTGEAKEDERKKVQAKEGKIILYGELAKAVFDHPATAPSLRTQYVEDPGKFAKSTQQHFVRLKKTYQEYRNKFKETGGGVLPEDEEANLTEKIQTEWVFYEDLHSIWSELPNYNTIGVSNSVAGQDFAGKAAAIFKGQVSSPEAASGLDEFDDDDEKSTEGIDDVGSEGLDGPGGVLSETEVQSTSRSRSTSEPTPFPINLEDNTSDAEDRKKPKVERNPVTITSTASTKAPPPMAKDRKPSASASTSMKKDRDEKSKKRTTTEALEDIHVLELKDAAARRSEKNAIRLKELELAQRKQDLEHEKHQAKVRKMELDAQKVAIEAKKSEMTLQMMFRMFQGQGGSSSIAGPSSATPFQFPQQEALPSYQQNSNLHFPSTSQAGISGGFTEQLYSEDLENFNLPSREQ